MLRLAPLSSRALRLKKEARVDRGSYNAYIVSGHMSRYGKATSTANLMNIGFEAYEENCHNGEL